MELETKRLILRKVKKSDWVDIVEGMSDLNITKQLASAPHPYTKEHAEKFISFTRKNEKAGKARVFMIELKSEKKVIGAISLEGINEFEGTATSASWINRTYWKKGYITEAKIAMNDFAFDVLKLNRLKSVVFVSNKASNATQKKVGYTFEGMSRQAKRSKATGKYHDVNTYGLLKKDWKKVRGALIKDLAEKNK